MGVKVAHAATSSPRVVRQVASISPFFAPETTSLTRADRCASRLAWGAAGDALCLKAAIRDAGPLPAQPTYPDCSNL